VAPGGRAIVNVAAGRGVMEQLLADRSDEYDLLELMS